MSEEVTGESLNADAFYTLPNFHTSDSTAFVVVGFGPDRRSVSVTDARAMAESLMNAAAEAEYLAATYLHCKQDCNMGHEEAGATAMGIRNTLAEVRQREWAKRRLKVAEINTVLPDNLRTARNEEKN